MTAAALVLIPPALVLDLAAWPAAALCRRFGGAR